MRYLPGPEGRAVRANTYSSTLFVRKVNHTESELAALCCTALIIVLRQDPRGPVGRVHSSSIRTGILARCEISMHKYI